MTSVEPKRMHLGVRLCRWPKVLPLAFLISGLQLNLGKAQESTDEPPSDPPGTEYSTGIQLLPQEKVDQLPRKPHFRAYLPKMIDLSKNVPKPGSQGRLGSCASWAVGYAARSYYTSKYENRILQNKNIASPRYLFDAARLRPCNDGNTFEEIVDVLKKGAASLEAVPYTDSCKPRSLSKSTVATEFKVDGLSKIFWKDANEFRGQLAIGNPVLLSFRVSKAFEGLRSHYAFADQTREFRNNDPEQWHGMTAIGYDDVRQAVLVINSWGRGWGNGGYAWISYGLIADDYWTREAFVLDVEKSDPPPEPNPEPPRPNPEPSPKPESSATVEAIRRELQQLQCAKITVVGDGADKVVSGFVGSRTDKNRVIALAGKNQALKVGQLLVAPWPACQVLETLYAPTQSSDGPAIEIAGQKSDWKEGETLSFRVRAPRNFSYVYVTYLQADGTALHLVQPQGTVPSQTPPRATLSFGEGRDGRAKFEVAAPFGDEVIVAVAARSPLFDHALPRSQPDVEYLSALRKALIYKPNPDVPDRIVSAAVVPIVTRGSQP